MFAKNPTSRKAFLKIPECFLSIIKLRFMEYNMIKIAFKNSSRNCISLKVLAVNLAISKISNTTSIKNPTREINSNMVPSSFSKFFDGKHKIVPMKLRNVWTNFNTPNRGLKMVKNLLCNKWYKYQ